MRLVSQNHAKVEGLVAKLREVEADVFGAAEFIRAKEGEADLKPLLASMVGMAAEVNGHLLRGGAGAGAAAQ